MKNKAISSEFVVPNSKASLSKQPKPQRYILLKLMLMWMHIYEDILATFEVHNVRKQSNEIIWVDLDVDGKPLKMELDTGSAVSIISFDLYQQKFNRLPLHKTGLSLKTYTGENIMPVGVLKVPVDYQNQREVLDLYVVKNKASLAT